MTREPLEQSGNTTTGTWTVSCGRCGDTNGQAPAFLSYSFQSGGRPSRRPASRGWSSGPPLQLISASKPTSTCYGMRAGTSWRTTATTPGRCRLTSATAISRIRRSTPHSHRVGSRVFGGINRGLRTAIGVSAALSATCVHALDMRFSRFFSVMCMRHHPGRHCCRTAG